MRTIVLALLFLLAHTVYASPETSRLPCTKTGELSSYTVSSDGVMVAWTYQENGKAHLCIEPNEERTYVYEVTQIESPAFVSNVTWSNNAEMLVYIVDSGEDQVAVIHTDAYIFDTNTESTTKIEESMAILENPTWAQGDKFVAFYGVDYSGLSWATIARLNGTSISWTISDSSIEKMEWTSEYRLDVLFIGPNGKFWRYHEMPYYPWHEVIPNI